VSHGPARGHDAVDQRRQILLPATVGVEEVRFHDKHQQLKTARNRDELLFALADATGAERIARDRTAALQSEVNRRQQCGCAPIGFGRFDAASRPLPIGAMTPKQVFRSDAREWLAGRPQQIIGAAAHRSRGIFSVGTCHRANRQ
jgi:hypothetical protein